MLSNFLHKFTKPLSVNRLLDKFKILSSSILFRYLVNLFKSISFKSFYITLSWQINISITIFQCINGLIKCHWLNLSSRFSIRIFYRLTLFFVFFNQWGKRLLLVMFLFMTSIFQKTVILCFIGWLIKRSLRFISFLVFLSYASYRRWSLYSVHLTNIFLRAILITMIQFILYQRTLLEIVRVIIFFRNDQYIVRSWIFYLRFFYWWLIKLRFSF